MTTTAHVCSAPLNFSRIREHDDGLHPDAVTDCNYCHDDGGPCPAAHQCNENHVHVEEDGEDMTCNDCGRPAFYDYGDERYHHLTDPERGCFLIAPVDPEFTCGWCGWGTDSDDAYEHHWCKEAAEADGERRGEAQADR